MPIVSRLHHLRSGTLSASDQKQSTRLSLPVIARQVQITQLQKPMLSQAHPSLQLLNIFRCLNPAQYFPSPTRSLVGNCAGSTSSPRRGEALYRVGVSDLASIESLARMLEKTIDLKDAEDASGLAEGLSTFAYRVADFRDACLPYGCSSALRHPPARSSEIAPDPDPVITTR